MRSLSGTEARRIALRAQGFADPAPKGPVTAQHFKRVIKRLGLLQLDSVQAVCRSHYLPVYSRLGVYDQPTLDKWLWHSGKMFETWSHEASVVPVEIEPLLRWTKREARHGATWAGLHKMATQRSGYVAGVLAEVQQNGPLSASDLNDPRPRKGDWWDGRSEGTRALDWLYRVGEVGIRRTDNFKRQYEAFAEVIPEQIRHQTTPNDEEAQRQLLLIAARCLGVATASDLADYFRLKLRVVRPRLTELLEERLLLPAEVEGWGEPAIVIPRGSSADPVKARALLSPFDPVVWCRPRAERLFGFHYRIEIYVPEAKRKYGYYVLPFLLGDQLVARVDLKAERTTGRLLVKGVYAETGVAKEKVARELSKELKRLQKFLGLPETVVKRRGNLASALRSFSK